MAAEHKRNPAAAARVEQRQRLCGGDFKKSGERSVDQSKMLARGMQRVTQTKLQPQHAHFERRYGKRGCMAAV